MSRDRRYLICKTVNIEQTASDWSRFHFTLEEALEVSKPKKSLVKSDPAVPKGCILAGRQSMEFRLRRAHSLRRCSFAWFGLIVSQLRQRCTLHPTTQD